MFRKALTCGGTSSAICQCPVIRRIDSVATRFLLQAYALPCEAPTGSFHTWKTSRSTGCTTTAHRHEPDRRSGCNRNGTQREPRQQDAGAPVFPNLTVSAEMAAPKASDRGDPCSHRSAAPPTGVYERGQAAGVVGGSGISSSLSHCSRPCP